MPMRVATNLSPRIGVATFDVRSFAWQVHWSLRATEKSADNRI
jgi:hypothetical protein